MLVTTSSPQNNATTKTVRAAVRPGRLRLVVLSNDGSKDIPNSNEISFKSILLSKNRAVFWAIEKLKLPVRANNQRQIDLVADSIIEKYNASMDNLIISNLMKTENDKDFAKSRIAEKISLLKKFVRSNFSNPERYSGENRKAFEEFKLLNDEKRQQVIDGLTSNLLSID